jgi:hypothetical protein
MMQFSEQQHAGFIYTIDHMRGEECISQETVHNLIPTEGANYLLSSSVLGGAPYTSWYIGLYTGNYTPTISSTMATFIPAAAELTTYTVATRPQWVPDAVANGSVINSATPATFTLNQTGGGDVTVYGGFMSSTPTKLSATGPLLSVVLFTSPKILLSGDIIKITAGITLLTQ